MAAEAARIRIGRVRLKAGGASVHLLPRPAPNEVVTHMRGWMNASIDTGRAPDAYAAVALWFEPEETGRPTVCVAYCTRHDALPAPVLCRMAAAYILEESARTRAAQEALSAIGAEPEDAS